MSSCTNFSDKEINFDAKLNLSKLVIRALGFLNVKCSGGPPE